VLGKDAGTIKNLSGELRSKLVWLKSITHPPAPSLEGVVIEELEFSNPIIDAILMLSGTFVTSSLFDGDLWSKRVPGKDAGTIE
jgi:hypothetical protein